MTPELTAKLELLVSQVNRDIATSNEQQRRHAEAWRKQHGTSLDIRAQALLDRGFLPGLLSALETGKPAVDQGRTPPYQVAIAVARELPGLGIGPEGITVLMAHCGLFKMGHRDQLWPPAGAAYDALFRSTGRPTLLEISTMLDQLGFDGGTLVLRSYLTAWGPGLGRTWPDEAVAPFMTVHLDKVLGMLGPGHEHDYSVQALGVFPALGTLPTLPPSVVDRLLASALGSRKTERLPAQDALAQGPGHRGRA